MCRLSLSLCSTCAYTLLPACLPALIPAACAYACCLPALMPACLPALMPPACLPACLPVQRKTMTGHSNVVTGVALSKNGTRAVTVSHGGAGGVTRMVLHVCDVSEDDAVTLSHGGDQLFLLVLASACLLLLACFCLLVLVLPAASCCCFLLLPAASCCFLLFPAAAAAAAAAFCCLASHACTLIKDGARAVTVPHGEADKQDQRHTRARSLSLPYLHVCLPVCLPAADETVRWWATMTDPPVIRKRCAGSLSLSLSLSLPYVHLPSCLPACLLACLSQTKPCAGGTR
jgi:hypothetical protein